MEVKGPSPCDLGQFCERVNTRIEGLLPREFPQRATAMVHPVRGYRFMQLRSINNTCTQQHHICPCKKGRSATAPSASAFRILTTKTARALQWQ